MEISWARACTSMAKGGEISAPSNLWHLVRLVPQILRRHHHSPNSRSHCNSAALPSRWSTRIAQPPRLTVPRKAGRPRIIATITYSARESWTRLSIIMWLACISLAPTTSELAGVLSPRRCKYGQFKLRIYGYYEK